MAYPDFLVREWDSRDQIENSWPTQHPFSGETQDHNVKAGLTDGIEMTIYGS